MEKGDIDMIISLNSTKHITSKYDTRIYIGEKNFDEIAVILPETVDGNATSELTFNLHLVNAKNEFLVVPMIKSEREGKQIASVIVDEDITDVAQDFYLYLEMTKNDGAVIGKTNVIIITINPLPDEHDRIIPKEEYEEIIDELAEIVEANTEAMNRIDGFEDGESAYQIAVDHGFVGTEEEWLASLKGAKGDKGDTGADGKSAYEIAVEHGYSGTESEWIAMLESGAITVIDSQTSAQWGDTIPATYTGRTGVPPEIAFRKDRASLWYLRRVEYIGDTYYRWEKIADTSDLNKRMAYHQGMSKRPVIAKLPASNLYFVGEVYDENWGRNIYILTATSTNPERMTIEYGWTPLRLTPVHLYQLPSGGTKTAWDSDGTMAFEFYVGDLIEVDGKIYECTKVNVPDTFPTLPFSYTYTWVEKEQPLTLSTLPIYDGSVV